MTRFRVRVFVLGLCALSFASLADAQSARLAGCANIMPLGDSITVGSNGGYRNDLFTGLQDNNCGVTYVGTQYDDNTRVADKHHEGHPFFSIGDIANGVSGWLAATQPNIVTLMIGTNDVAWWSEETPEQVAARHNALIDQIQKARPDAWIFVASIPPETSAPLPPRNIDRATFVANFNAAIRANVDARVSAGQHVRLVDVYSALTPADLSQDGVHPTEAGYAKIAQKFLEAIRAALDGVNVANATPSPAPDSTTPAPTPPPPAPTSTTPPPAATPVEAPARAPAAGVTHHGGGAIGLPWLAALLGASLARTRRM